MLWMLILGCAPPPLDGADLPSVSFVFPESRTDVVVCPNFMVTVDVDNWDIVIYEQGQESQQESRIGHWHLLDAGEDPIAFVTERWVQVSLDGDFSEPTPTVLKARLANNDHTELNLSDFPDATATAEFLVGDVEDCVGGGATVENDTEY